MKPQVGLKIIENTGYGFTTHIIRACTDKTMSTGSTYGFETYKRVSFHDGFRVSDEATLARLLQLEQQQKELWQEALDLFYSLEKLGEATK